MFLEAGSRQAFLKSWGELEKIEKEKEELRQEMAKFRQERDSENRHQMSQLKQKEAEIKAWMWSLFTQKIAGPIGRLLRDNDGS